VSIEVKLPALSPTMEKGTLARWLVKPGDIVKRGDLIAEIETDKATIEFESIEEGWVEDLVVAEGADDIPVGAVIATLADALHAVRHSSSSPAPEPVAEAPRQFRALGASPVSVGPLIASLARARAIDLDGISGTGSGGRITRADLGLEPTTTTRPAVALVVEAPAPPVVSIPEIPHSAAKLSNMRRTITRRLTGSKRDAPHIYLTVDIELDGLLSLRKELNGSLESRGVKLSVNDMLIKAQALALMEAPSCNVMLAADTLITFQRADIAVAVSIPNGLVTPVIAAADTKTLSAIATEMKDLTRRARAGELKPEEYSGGTASLSNMGMFQIRQFGAVINPPQGMILAIGAGEMRAWAKGDGTLSAATIMSVTGSFDHRAIDGADGAKFMIALKSMIETPIRLTL
jgi:pyruvate dehydrogenase E2 component (dihydrolipoamide acetyltransferase)